MSITEKESSLEHGNENDRIYLNKFSEILKSIRLTHKISQEKMADRIGCSRIHITRLETGKRNPSKILLKAIEREFTLNEEQIYIITHLKLG